MILQLIDNDILYADTASSTNCPLVRGLKRVLHVDNIMVGMVKFHVGEHVMWCSQEMRNFIYSFDYHNRHVIKLDIDIPYDPPL